MKLRTEIFFLLAFSALKIQSQTFSFRHFNEESGLMQNYIYHISQSAKGHLVLSTGEGLSIFDGSKFTSLSNKTISENFVTTHLVDSREIIWLGHAQNGISWYRNGKFHSIKHPLINEKKITKMVEDDKKNIWFSTSGGDIFKIDSNFKFHPSGLNIAESVLSICFDNENRMLAATASGIKLLGTSMHGKLKHLGDLDFLKNKMIRQVISAGENSNAFWVSTQDDGVYGIQSVNGVYRQFAHFFEQLCPLNSNISCIYSDASQNLWVAIFGEGLRRITSVGDPLKKNYVVSRIDQKNGLKNLHVQSIYQDEEGNMWFGTFGGGLIEKPVEKFSFYGSREKIEDNNVKALSIDSAGNVWIGSENGLACLNREKGTYVFYNANKGFVNDRVNALLTDAKGNLWIGTHQHGVFVMRKNGTGFENFSKLNHLDHMMVNTIIESRKKIIIGTTEGVYAWDEEDHSIESLSTEDGLLHNNVLQAFNDSKNRLWLCSHSAVPYFIQNKSIHSFRNIAGLNSFNINAVCEDKNGNIWIATEGDGVFKFNDQHFINYTTENGLLSNYCYGIGVDANNSVWVTHRSGLSEKRSFYKDFVSVQKQNGLLFCENNLNAVYRDELKNLWLGTSEGIVHYDARLSSNSSSEPKLNISKITMNDVSYLPDEKIEKKYGYYFVHIDFNAISFTDPGSMRYKYRLLGADSSWKTTSSSFVEFPGLSDGDFTFQLMACNSNGVCSQVPARVFFRIQAPVWKQTWFYVFMCMFLIFSTYMIIYLRIRNLKKSQVLLQETVQQKTFLLLQEKEEVEKIKIELEHKNKDITDSISYAKRIQDSLLPPRELMDKLFRSEYFVLYKPKDIVSGDFYWAASMNSAGQELALASVLDCTGHGVPGAFLSIVANDFLKQGLFERKISDTAEILEFLNAHICANLNQSQSGVMVRDGMDMALIAIDFQNLKLHFSGANNPAYIFRKKENQTELIILKPTKRAIGMMGEEITSFGKQTVDVQKGDMIYLFSDGYSDQFGGGKGKKLGHERFKSILSEAAAKPISEQSDFLNKTIVAWQGETEQTDDICVMGLGI